MSGADKPRILIAYHSRDHAEEMGVFFSGQGYRVDAINTVRQAEELLVLTWFF
jgi:hypothetical protein